MRTRVALLSLFWMACVALAEEVEKTLPASDGGTSSAARDSIADLNARVRDLFDAGKTAEALPLAERATSLAESRWGNDSPDTATCYRWQWRVLERENGKPEKQKALIDKAMKIREAKLGVEHPDYAESLNDLGEYLIAGGKADEAVVQIRKALAIRQKTFGEEHPATAESLGDLGVALNAAGRADDARPLLEKSLAIHERIRPCHVSTSLVMFALAECVAQQQELGRAESLYERGIACLEKTVGADHLFTARGLNSLTLVYGNQGKYALAEPLVRRSLGIMEKARGPDHPETAVCLTYLAWLHGIQGKYAEAEPLSKRALAIYEKSLGPDHPETASALVNLGDVYYLEDKHSQAEPLFKRAVAIREKALGRDHQDVAKGLRSLAHGCAKQRRFAEADSLYKRALRIFEKSLGAGHPEVAATLISLADTYVLEAKPSQAEPLCRRAVAIREKTLGEDHPDTAANIHLLAMALAGQGKFDDAEPLFKRALAIREKTLGADHVDTAISLNELAVLYENQGKGPKAKPLFKRALAILDKSLGGEHPTTVTVRENLSNLVSGLGPQAAEEGPANKETAGEDIAVLNDQVGELFDRGDYPAATQLAEKALAVAERKFGRESAETAPSINNLAVLYKVQGRYTEADSLYRRAIAIREKTHGPHDALTATSLSNLAVFYKSQGRFREAEPLATRALAIFEKSLGPEHPDTASALGNLAELYRAQGRYSQAEPLHERAVAIKEKKLGPEHPGTAKALNNLAILLDEQGHFSRAEPLFRRALAIDEKALGPDHPDTASTLGSLASLLMSQGRYAEAAPLHARALAIREKALGPEHEDTALSLNGLAMLHCLEGRYAEAEPLYKRALAICEKSLGPQHPTTATALVNLAALHDEQSRYAQAEPLYRRALAIFEKSLGRDHPSMAGTLTNLGLMHEAQGEHAKAETCFKQSLAIRQKSLGAEHPDTAASLNNIAMLHRLQGRSDEAMLLLEKSLASREQVLGPDHPATIESLDNLAVINAAAGRWSEAAGFVDRARHGTRRHVSRVLPSLSYPEQAKFLERRHAAYLHGALSLGLLQRVNPKIATLSAGWLANGKAVAHEAAAQRIILARQSQNPATKASVTAIERVRADLAKLSQATPATADAAAWRDKLSQLQAEEHRLIREIGGQVAALDREEPWVELDAIRKNVPAGGVLVDIARFEVFDFKARSGQSGKQPARYAAWIVPPAGVGAVTIVDLGPAEEIDAAVQAYREAIEAVQKAGFSRGQAMAEDELKVTAAPLSTKVLQPIIEAIGDATEVILSPDGSLWLVPWQAVTLVDGTYAIEKLAIRTVTSARDLVPVPANGSGVRGGPVVVADPAFDASIPISGKPSVDTSRAVVPAAGVTWRFSPLPGTRSEAMATKLAIAKVSGSEPKVLLGADANETKLKQAAVRPASLVLATHGFFKPDQEVRKDEKRGLESAAAGGRGSVPILTTDGDPLEDPLLRCGLALAGANVAAKAAAGDDGILTGAEIVGLDLMGTDLVVLSACETGVGRVQVGEGVAGLRQAFQIAGAKAVVATLWQIPDAESSRIMQDFYGHLEKGEPAAKSLREAQLAFIKQRREDRNYESAHPYLWAAYGVTGR